MATLHWKQAIGALAATALIVMLCLRLILDTVRLWNGQAIMLADRWTMVGPGDWTSGFMLHLATQSRSWIGSLSILLVVCLYIMSRSPCRSAIAMRMGMIAVGIVAPTLLTNMLILRGQQLPKSWFVLSGGATLAPLAIWLVWELRSRRTEKKNSNTILYVATTSIVIGALLVGLAWLRTGVDMRGRWASFLVPVPSPQFVTSAASDRCTREALLAAIDNWGKTGEVTGIEWVVVAKDGQIVPSPSNLVPYPGGVTDWHPTSDRLWWEDHELGPGTAFLLLIDERAPRARVEQIERALAEAAVDHVARVGVRWREFQPIGLPALDIGVLCVEGQISP